MRNCVSFILILFCPILCLAETIQLKSGKKVEGKILEQTDQYIKVDTGLGVTVTYYQDEIEQMVATPHPSPESPPEDKLTQLENFVSEWGKVDPNSVKELLEGIYSKSTIEAVRFVRHRIDSVLASPEGLLTEGMLLDAALEENPDDPILLYEYGYLLGKGGHPQEAIDVLLEVKKIKPDLPYLYLSLGHDYAEQDRPIEAVAFYQQELTNNKAGDKELNSRVYGNLGVAYKRLKEYEKSIEANQKAIELDPTFPYPYQNLGSTYQKLKDWDKAIEYGLKAISIQSYPAAHSSLGSAYYGKEMYPQAIEQFKSSLEQYPADHFTLVDLGNSYLKLDRYVEAEEVYRKAIEVKPDYVRALAGIGWAKNKLGQYDQAIEYLEKALRYKSDDSFAQDQLQIARHAQQNPSNVHGDLGNFQDSLEEAKKFLQDAYQFMEEQKFQESMPLIKRSIEVNAKDPLAYRYLAYCQYYLNDFSSASEALKKAMSLDPYNADIAKDYACTLHKLGRLDEAYQVVREISEKVPENQAFKKLLEDIQSRNMDALRMGP